MKHRFIFNKNFGSCLALWDWMFGTLYVPEKAFAASIHGGLQCVNCHADLSGKELPHEPGVAKVSCAECHDAEAKQHAASLHGQALKRGDCC